MKLATSKQITNGVYQASLSTSDWSQRDLQLIARTGEPMIQVGGSFSDNMLAVDYEIPERTVGVRTGSPFTVRFDSRDFPNADDMATVWARQTTTAITSAVEALRLRNDSYIGETVTTI